MVSLEDVNAILQVRLTFNGLRYKEVVFHDLHTVYIQSLFSSFRQVLQYGSPRYMRVPSLDVCYFMASCTASINKHDRIIAARKTLYKLLLEWEDIQPVRTSISLISYIQIEVIKILWILYEPLE